LRPDVRDVRRDAPIGRALSLATVNDPEKRLSAGLLDVFIRAGLVFVLAVLCY